MDTKEQKIIFNNYYDNNEKLKLSAKRLEERGYDDYIIPTGYIGRYSEMYNSWMKAGIIYYYINDFENAKNCFYKAYKYIYLIEKENKNFNLLILINLCDKNMNKELTYDINHKMTYSSKIFSNNFIKTLEKHNIEMTKKIRDDIKIYLQNCEFNLDLLYFIEILLNPSILIICLSIIYLIINK